MKKSLISRIVLRTFVLFSVLVSLLPSAFPRQASTKSPAHVKPGIDVLRDRGFDILKGKRVGLITNPTGVSAGVEHARHPSSREPAWE